METKLLSKDDFIELFNDYNKHEEMIDDLDKIFPCAWESKLFNSYYKLFEKIKSLCFTEEGIDWIDWWMYESSSEERHAWDEDGNEIPTETIEDLWNLVEKYRK